MKKIKKSGIFTRESSYAGGSTILNCEQLNLLEAISKALNYSHDNYVNLPRNYAPKGLIAILHDQVKAKLEYGTITTIVGVEATAMIDVLEIKLLQENNN